MAAAAATLWCQRMALLMRTVKKNSLISQLSIIVDLLHCESFVLFPEHRKNIFFSQNLP